MEPPAGTDPAASSLPRTCSAIELRGHAFREQDSNLRAPGSKPSRDAVNPPRSEPPPGADPGLPPYRGGVTAVCGGRVRPAGFEPASSRLSTWRLCHWATNAQSLWTVSNRLPPQYECGALPDELQRRGYRGWNRTSVLLIQSQGGMPATHPVSVREERIELSTACF